MKLKQNDNERTIYKISKPEAGGVIQRNGLTRMLDKLRKKPVIWVSGIPGAGKTTFIVSYLKSHRIPYIYYHLDKGDAELPTFFYYLGRAVTQSAAAAGNNRSKRSPAPQLPLLTPEHLQDIPAFTRLFFRDLFARFGTRKQFVVVFDNYQDVPAGSLLHQVFAAGLSLMPGTLPKGQSFIFISKSEPPPAFSRLRTADRIGFISDHDIRFTVQETLLFLRKRGLHAVSAPDAKRFHDRVQGWPAGLVLLIEKYRKEDAHRIPETLLEERFFHYFADEIFNKLDARVQDFLLKTAFLPKITVTMAEQLTGMEHPEKLLTRLHLENYFTVRLPSSESAYHYHSLFREFLMAHAASLFTKQEMLSLRTKAAELLEQAGEFEEAANLYCTAQNWGGLARLVLHTAQSLLTQGRNSILLQWMNQLPAEMIDTAPWLLYWYGVAVLPASITKSRGMLEKAYALFRQQSGVQSNGGSFLSWAGIARTYCIEWHDFKPLDHWIGEMNEFLASTPFPSSPIEIHVVSVMLLAMIYRRPGFENIAPWIQRAEAILQSGNNGQADSHSRAMLMNYLLLYYSWIGDITRMGVLMETHRPVPGQRGGRDGAPGTAEGVTPLELILGQVIRCIYLWFTVSPETPAAVEGGLDMANRYGVHLWDHMFFAQGAYYALTTGNMSAAEKHLAHMQACMDKSHTLDRSHYYSLRSYYSHLRGDLPVALRYAEQALDTALQAGTPFPEALCRLALAQVQASSKNYDKARYNLSFIMRTGYEMHSLMLQYHGFLLGAQIDFGSGNESSGNEQLRNAMRIGKEQGYINHWRWMPDTMLDLCIRALQAGIEVPYVQGLIRRRGLAVKSQQTDAPSAPSAVNIIDIAQWPWAFRVHTLGNFLLIRDETPLEFSGKVQKMPLAMLKALIASGGVDVREESISDALWPDTEGDKSHSAFSTTLQRLRFLTGSDRCIQLKEGRLSLNPSCCWVDVWSFEHLLDRAHALWAGSADQAFAITLQAVDLYKGSFLPNDQDQWWTTSMRERTKSKFIRAIVRLGHYLEEHGQWTEAAGYYQKGLEADNLSEEFYQSLMLCYQSEGKTGEALAVYAQCKRVLASILDIEPSQKTEAIYRTIKASSTR